MTAIRMDSFPETNILDHQPYSDRNDRRLELARDFLDRGDFDSAVDYCNRVLDENPRDGYAYYWRLMAELRCRHEADLVKVQGLASHRTFDLAYRCASPALAAKLDGILAAQKNAARKRIVVKQEEER